MSQVLHIHPDNPQARLIHQAAQCILSGGVVVLPTDACYVLVAQLDNKDAVRRIRQIRAIDEKHHLTMLCRDLSEIAQYAKIDNRQYRLLKAATPGVFTFILEATKEVPRRLSHPSRKTIGLRVPSNTIAQALLTEVGTPLVSATLKLPGEDEALTDVDDIENALDKQVDMIIDGGTCYIVPSTVIDVTQVVPEIIRQGKGDASLLGIE